MVIITVVFVAPSSPRRVVVAIAIVDVVTISVITAIGGSLYHCRRCCRSLFIVAVIFVVVVTPTCLPLSPSSSVMFSS
jgi:hypothetical protein